jgi:hypothetical protein
MSAGGRDGDALFRDPLPEGFLRHIVRLAPGAELDVDRIGAPDAIVIVDEGEAELECRAGGRRRFERGSMIPIARFPIRRIRSVGPGPLVLVVVSRASLGPTDEFPSGRGSYVDS